MKNGYTTLVLWKMQEIALHGYEHGTSSIMSIS